MRFFLDETGDVYITLDNYKVIYSRWSSESFAYQMLRIRLDKNKVKEIK